MKKKQNTRIIRLFSDAKRKEKRVETIFIYSFHLFDFNQMRIRCRKFIIKMGFITRN